MIKSTKTTYVFILMLLGLVVSGCGAKNEQGTAKQQEKENISLTVWGAQDDLELLGEMSESFKEKYADEATFTFNMEAVDEGICKNVILEDVNSTADVFAFGDDQLMTIAAGGIISPIEDKEQVVADNLEAAIEAATINDQLYAYPMTADNGYFMYYNKKYFSDSDVKNLNRMLEIAEKKNKKVVMDWSSGWYLYSFFGNSGLKLGLNDDMVSNYCDWNATSGEIKGLDIANAMLSIAKSPAFYNTQDDGFVKGVQDGTVIAGVSGMWNANHLQKAWGEDYAAVKLPTYTVAGKELQMASYAGYKLVGVNAYSDHKDWATKFAQWITNEENQKLRFMKRGLGPSNSNAANSPEVQASIAMQALLEQSQYSSLQRVGEKYWDAVQEFGLLLANEPTKAGNLQKRLDTMVKSITSNWVDK